VPAAAGGPEGGSPTPAPEPIATASPTKSKRGGSLPQLPTSVWLVIIGVMTIVFIAVCLGHGSDPVFMTVPADTTPAPPSSAPSTSVVILIPPTPSPSIVAELDTPRVTPPPTSVAGTSPPSTAVTSTTVAMTTTTSVPITTTTTITTTTVAPTTTTTTTTAVPATIAPTTTPPATTTLPAATTTAPTTVAPTGPVVHIIGNVGPCRFGPECLLAGFAIERFFGQPTQYVCEFATGARYTFRFDGDRVDYACATGNPDSSITIEVDGIRSETFRHPGNAA
jgi:hypothetical protein